MHLTKPNPFLIYLLKFLGIFGILYATGEAVIGLSAPGGLYSPFVDHYLNYPTLLRSSLLLGGKSFLALFGIDAYVHDVIFLRIRDGLGIRMVYSCLGLGIMSCWVAFVVANKGSVRRKITWLLTGLVLIWVMNVGRVVLVLLAANRQWATLFELDHHTLFNIAAYIALFILAYFFDRSGSKNHRREKGPVTTTSRVSAIPPG